MLEDHDVKVVCPWCASIHDGALSLSSEGGAPEDGSINICVTCSRISIYEREASGGLRTPTDEEMTEAMADLDVVKALWALRRSHYWIKRKVN